MTRVYTVKSNARRDARKLGLNPDLVVPARGGGFVINYPDAKPSKKAKSSKASKAAKKPRKAREGDPKKDKLVAMLADWTSIDYLMAHLDWQAHTVRGAISTAAKARGISIERQRIDGVTSYRVAG